MRDFVTVRNTRQLLVDKINTIAKEQHAAFEHGKLTERIRIIQELSRLLPQEGNEERMKVILHIMTQILPQGEEI